MPPKKTMVMMTLKELVAILQPVVRMMNESAQKAFAEIVRRGEIARMTMLFADQLQPFLRTELELLVKASATEPMPQAKQVKPPNPSSMTFAAYDEMCLQLNEAQVIGTEAFMEKRRSILEKLPLANDIARRRKLSWILGLSSGKNRREWFGRLYLHALHTDPTSSETLLKRMADAIPEQTPQSVESQARQSKTWKRHSTNSG